jgi:hypothetical protein
VTPRLEECESLPCEGGDFPSEPVTNFISDDATETQSRARLRQTGTAIADVQCAGVSWCWPANGSAQSQKVVARYQVPYTAAERSKRDNR